MLCKTCGLEKPAEEMYLEKGRRRSICKLCRKEYAHRHYQENKQRYHDLIDSRLSDLKEWVLDLKSSKGCQVCGERHPACLDFHHRDPNEKETEISDAVLRGWGKLRLMEEMHKCDILCSNCHRKKHFDEKTGPWMAEIGV